MHPHLSSKQHQQIIPPNARSPPHTQSKPTSKTTHSPTKRTSGHLYGNCRLWLHPESPASFIQALLQIVQVGRQMIGAILKFPNHNCVRTTHLTLLFNASATLLISMHTWFSPLLVCMLSHVQTSLCNLSSVFLSATAFLH